MKRYKIWFNDPDFGPVEKEAGFVMVYDGDLILHNGLESLGIPVDIVARFPLGVWRFYEVTKLKSETIAEQDIQDLDKKPYVLKKVPTLKIARSAAEPGKLMGFYDAKVLTPEEVYQLVVDYLDAMEYGELP